MGHGGALWAAPNYGALRQFLFRCRVPSRYKALNRTRSGRPTSHHVRATSGLGYPATE